jgi:hypothetical protein
MNITVTYDKKKVSSYDELLNCFSPKEFNSPFRSTVPNLSYWSWPDIGERVLETCQSLKLNIPESLTVSFEYQVDPPKGEGKASHTDLMLTWDGHCIAIEAKYTEGEYELVENWLAEPLNENDKKKGRTAADKKNNRIEVLRGWCKLINDRTGASLSENNVNDLTYQVLHRVASACFIKAGKCIVIYQGFSLPSNKFDYYRGELEKIYHRVGCPQTLDLYLYNIPIEPSGDYSRLQERWNEKKERHLSSEVLKGLMSGSFMSFAQPDIHKIT